MGFQLEDTADCMMSTFPSRISSLDRSPVPSTLYWAGSPCRSRNPAAMEAMTGL